MPEVTLRHEIQLDEDAFWSKIVFDETFNRLLYVDHLAFVGWSLLEQRDTGSEIVRRVRVEPNVQGMPAAVKKVLGDRLSYTEEGTFSKATKRYAFRITPSALVEKTKVSGEMWCEGLGDGRIARFCKMSVAVNVFLIGSMVEERILADLRSSYDRGTAFANDYIARNGQG